MDYEKKYKEALERARQIKDGKDEWRYSDLAEIIPALTYIFPQLRESEDETTRKELLTFVRSFWADHKEKLPQASRWVTYLEKQKINTEGDFGRGYDCGYQAGYAVAKNEMKPKVATATPDSCKESLHIPETCKENADSFTQEIPMPDSTTLLKMWDDEEKMLREKGIDDMWRLAYNAFLDGFAQGMMVRQKEQKKDNPLEDFSKGYNAGYYHGRTDNEQKPELVPHPITYMYPSDASRDEQLKMALLALLNSDSIKVAGKKFTKQDLIDWVEQKPQPHWKPSEEQLNALNFAITYFMHETNYKNPTELRELYDDLLKLK